MTEMTPMTDERLGYLRLMFKACRSVEGDALAHAGMWGLEVIDDNVRLRAELAATPTADMVFEAIAHGDEEHRGWLAEALRNIWRGEPVPEPRGKNTNADLEAQLAAKEAENERLTEVLRDIAYNTSSSVPPEAWPVDHYRWMMNRAVSLAANALTPEVKP